MTLPEATLENVKHAAQDLIEWKGRDVLKALLDRYEARNVSMIPGINWHAFMRDCYALIGGESAQRYPQGPRPDPQTPDVVEWKP